MIPNTKYSSLLSVTLDGKEIECSRKAKNCNFEFDQIEGESQIQISIAAQYSQEEYNSFEPDDIILDILPVGLENFLVVRS